MLLIRLLRCITTLLLFLIVAVPGKIFILSLGSLTTPLLLEWMVSPVWCSRELHILLTQSCLICSILVPLLAAYLMPGSYLVLFLFSSLVILTILPPITDQSLLNPSAANFLKRSSMASSSNISTPTISSLTGNLVSCPSYLPPMLDHCPPWMVWPPGRTQKYCYGLLWSVESFWTCAASFPSSQTSCCRCCRSTTFLVQVLPFLQNPVGCYPWCWFQSSPCPFWCPPRLCPGAPPLPYLC